MDHPLTCTEMTMIVRTLDEITDTDQDARGDGWRARRHFVRRDGLGFSLSETTVEAGREMQLWYKHHQEACYVIEGEAGALPLLSHALRETWAHREGRTLTVTGYHASGGIREAVARSAEEVYEGVPENSRAIVRDLMLRLVTSTPDGGPVRSRVPRRLVSSDEQHSAVVEQLVRARLLTSDDGVLVLAHEALVAAVIALVAVVLAIDGRQEPDAPVVDREHRHVGAGVAPQREQGRAVTTEDDEQLAPVEALRGGLLDEFHLFRQRNVVLRLCHRVVVPEPVDVVHDVRARTHDLLEERRLGRGSAGTAAVARPEGRENRRRRAAPRRGRHSHGTAAGRPESVGPRAGGRSCAALLPGPPRRRPGSCAR